MSYMLILGAESDLAKVVADRYAQAGYDLYLAGKDIERLTYLAKNLEIRYEITVKTCKFDPVEFYSNRLFYTSLSPKPLGVIWLNDCIIEQQKAQKNFSEAKNMIDNNFAGCISILNLIANDFEERKNGFIIGLTSIAGELLNYNNPIYASTHSAVFTYLSGLRNRLAKSKIQVLIVKNGNLLRKSIEPQNTSILEKFAEIIYDSQQKKKKIIYLKPYQRYIVPVLNLLPNAILRWIVFR